MNASPAPADPAEAHAALMAALSPPRLPAAGSFEFWQTVLAAFSLGILAMLLLVALLALVSRRREGALAGTIARLAAARSLAPEKRLLVQAQVLRDVAAADARPRPALAKLAAEIGAALYAPRPSLDPEATEAAIRAAIGRR